MNVEDANTFLAREQSDIFPSASSSSQFHSWLHSLSLPSPPTPTRILQKLKMSFPESESKT